MGYQTFQSHLLSTPQHISSNMKVLSVFMACVMACQGFVVPATTLVRAPSHDSAIIRSDRLGGNFAYSVQEGHAYAAVSPVVEHVAHPVAVSYQVPVETHVVEAQVEHRAFPYIASYPGAHYASYPTHGAVQLLAHPQY